MQDLKTVTQFESALRCTAERSTISAACDFYRDDVNEEQQHSKIQQYWQPMI